MRRFDKTKNILKANLLAEQRYLESKGLIKEVTDNYDDTADRAGKSGINQFGDKEYEERQKLMNLPNDNIIYNIEQNGVEKTYSFGSKGTGTAKIEVYGDNDGEVIATYYFELADLNDDRPWVGLIFKGDNSPGNNANISKEADEYITDMIENDQDLIDEYSKYARDEYLDKLDGNPFYDRHERLD